MIGLIVHVGTIDLVVIDIIVTVVIVVIVVVVFAIVTVNKLGIGLSHPHVHVDVVDFVNFGNVSLILNLKMMKSQVVVVQLR